MAMAPQLVGRVGCVVDLSAAYRLKDRPAVPGVLRLRARPAGAARRRGLRPAGAAPPRARRGPAGRHARLLRHRRHARPATTRGGRLIEPHGRDRRRRQRRDRCRAARSATTTCSRTVDENFTAYGLLDHRHTPGDGAGDRRPDAVHPHLAPMNRGILATCYARPRPVSVVRPTSCSTCSPEATPTSRSSPSPRHHRRPRRRSARTRCTSRRATTSGPGTCRDAAIDNLTKGAPGGAVQSANVALGLAETAGSPT